MSSYLVEALQEQQQPLTEAMKTVLNASPQQLLKCALLGFLAYPALVSLLRFRRLRSLHQKHHYPTRESMAKMTNDDAWGIQKVAAQLEFPFMYTKALQFALFRVRRTYLFRPRRMMKLGSCFWLTDVRNPLHFEASDEDERVLKPPDGAEALL